MTLIASLALACGSQTATDPPVTTPAHATASSPPASSPGGSPTPVPGGPTGDPLVGTFQTRLMLGDGTYALPVVVLDATGLVTGIEPGPQGVWAAHDVSIENAPDGQNALIYTWLGGACDGTATFTFERTGDRFRLSASTMRVGDTCILIGLQRRLRIQLSEPVDAARVNIDAN